LPEKTSGEQGLAIIADCKSSHAGIVVFSKPPANKKSNAIFSFQVRQRRFTAKKPCQMRFRQPYAVEQRGNFIDFVKNRRIAAGASGALRGPGALTAREARLSKNPRFHGDWR
jgi:hypothetical protein